MISVSSALLSILISSIVVYSFAFAWAKNFIHRAASSYVTCIASSGVAVAMLLLALIPLDVFNISGYNLNPDGTQQDPNGIHKTGDTMQFIFYTLYVLFVFYLAFILPFTYFYLEEDYGERTKFAPVIAALKYTMGFVSACLAFVLIGLVISNNTVPDPNGWMHYMNASYTSLDGVLTFIIGIFSLMGLVVWNTYTAYGMAALPIYLYRDRVESKPYDRLSLVSAEDLGMQLNNNNNPAGQTKEEGTVEGANEKPHLPYDVVTKGLDVCWHTVRPLSSILAFVFWFINGVILLMLMISTISKLKYSECGYSCGYSFPSHLIFNPIDAALTTTSKMYPLDYMVFAFITIYLFICSFYGVKKLGIRKGSALVFEVKRYDTQSSAVIISAGILMLSLLVVNMQISTLSPHYAFLGGDQTYYEGNSTDAKICDLSNSFHVTGPDQCIYSEMGLFVTKLYTQFPFFGCLLTLSNIIFLVAQLVCNIIIFDRLFGPFEAKTNTEAYVLEEDF